MAYQTDSSFVTDLVTAETYFRQAGIAEDETTFVFFHPERLNEQPEVLHGKLRDRFAEFTKLNQAGYDGYFCANQTDLLGWEPENIIRPRLNFFNCDGRPLPSDWNGEKPDALLLTSPGHYQGSYRPPPSGQTMEAWVARQKELQRRYGTNSIDCSLVNKLMRLPGLHRHKGEPPFMVKMVEASQSRSAASTEADILARCPTLRSYINRIGAIQRNFRRYVVEEDDEGTGYKRDRATITLKDGKLSCSIKDLAPTETEQQAIKSEISVFSFPESVDASKNGKLPDQLNGVDRNHYFVFLDKSGNKIKFIQWRREGEKPDLPFSFWGDGKWRMMEPDGLLPLYNLDKLKLIDKPKDGIVLGVMIHEGAKTAQHVDWLVNSIDDEARKLRAKHPWTADLGGYVHLGWPGGVNSAHLVDWSPIVNLRPNARVILACDRDVRGENVSSQISQILRRTLMALMFDDRFCIGFDLADAWPSHKEWWDKHGHYRGPTLDDCLFPATWATETYRKEDVKKPVHRITTKFADEWWWAEGPNAFIHRNQVNLLRPEKTFNMKVRSFSHVDDTARLLTQTVSSKCDGVDYRPGQRPGVFNERGMKLVNTYRPSDVVGINGITDDDVKPFTDFIDHLFPLEKERRKVMRWIVTIVSRPGVRMRYGLLLISEKHGVGKTTLGEILKVLVGPWNVSFPTELSITSGYHDWIAHKTMAIISEIWSDSGKKLYNLLKDIVDDSKEINRKYLHPYTLGIYLHLFACSNSKKALHFDDSDRRFLVPKVTEELRPEEIWIDFHEWLNSGGYQIIKGYLDKLALDPSYIVGAGEHAPPTATKNEIILDSKSDGQKLAYDLGLMVRDKRKEDDDSTKIVLAVDEVRGWIASRRGLSLSDTLRMEKPLTIKKELLLAGLKEPRLRPGENRKRYWVNIGTEQHVISSYSYVVANFKIEAGAEWEDLKTYFRQAGVLKPDDM